MSRHRGTREQRKSRRLEGRARRSAARNALDGVLADQGVDALSADHMSPGEKLAYLGAVRFKALIESAPAPSKSDPKRYRGADQPYARKRPLRARRMVLSPTLARIRGGARSRRRHARLWKPA